MIGGKFFVFWFVLFCVFSFAVSANGETNIAAAPLGLTLYQELGAPSPRLTIDWQPFERISLASFDRTPSHSAQYQDKGLQVIEARYWALPPDFPAYIRLSMLKSGGSQAPTVSPINRSLVYKTFLQGPILKQDGLDQMWLYH